MDQQRYRLDFEGVSALVMNNNESVGNDELKRAKGRDPAAWEREHFREKAYTNDAGQLVVPARCIKKSLIEGCKFLPEKPKGTQFKSYAPLVQTALLVLDDAVLDHTVEDLIPWTVIVNLDPSKGPRGPRGPRTRPMVPIPWHCQVEIMVVDPSLSLEVIERIAERAGKQCGLLDARAIDYGRCFITVKIAGKVRAA